MTELMARPGKMAIQGAVVMNRRLGPLSIAPHEGVGGWIPSPRNEREASAMMAVPKDSEPRIKTGAKILGSR